MMTLCHRCSLAIRVLDRNDEVDTLIGDKSDFWPDQYPCPECSRNTKVVDEGDTLSSTWKGHVVDLTTTEAFIAYSGVGLPSQRAFSVEELEKKLIQTPIKRINGTSSSGGTGRYILESLELWDGTKVFFGASPMGAVIYRVASPYSYAEEK